ncbi:transmembrane protein 231 [Schistosoma japonicum]|nr:transmembrane protein 231 [Schistosoma japonicum]
MALFEIYRCPVFREIHFPLFHIGTLFHLVITITSIIVPFFICYRSGGFWLRDSIYIEQPQIRFLKQVYIELKSSNRTIYAWSTYTALNAQLSSNLIIPHMSIQQLDDDYDGIYDKLKLKFQFPIEDKINHLYIVLLFSYQLKNSIVNNEQYKLKDLQSESIQKYLSKRYGNESGYVSSLLKSGRGEEDEGIFIDTLTLKVDPKYEIWTLGSANFLDQLVLNLTLFYKPSKIWSHPNIFQMLWWGWIQYFPILLFSLFVADRIKAFVYGHHLIHGFLMKYDKILYSKH